MDDIKIPFDSELDEIMYNAISSDYNYSLDSVINPNFNIPLSASHAASVNYESSYSMENADVWDDGLSKIRKKYICLYCHSGFDTPQSRKHHIEISHIQEYKFICRTCQMLFADEGEYNCHVNLHKTGKEIKCQVCDKIFFNIKDLNTHLKDHIVEVTYCCTICSEEFKDKYAFEIHHKNHAGDKTKAKDKRLQSVPLNENCKSRLPKSHSQLKLLPGKSLLKELTYSCPKCTQSFNSKDSFAKHLEEHNKRLHEYKKQNPVPSTSKINPHSVACTKCGLPFKNGEEQNKHICKDSITDKLKFYCEICGKGFNHSASVKRHTKLHTSENSCPICREVCGDENALREHLKIHAGESVFKCAYCGKYLRNIRSLKKHTKTHENVEKKVINKKRK